TPNRDSITSPVSTNARVLQTTIQPSLQRCAPPSGTARSTVLPTRSYFCFRYCNANDAAAAVVLSIIPCPSLMLAVVQVFVAVPLLRRPRHHQLAQMDAL